MFSQHQFDAGSPIYMQIMQKIKMLIISGEWKPGQRMPTVRELAINYGVNPNTMQRSLLELERESLLYSERTSGRFVTQDEELIKAVRDTVSKEIVKKFKEEMYQLGYNDEEISSLLGD